MIYTLNFFNISKKVNDRALEMKRLSALRGEQVNHLRRTARSPTYFSLLECLALRAFLPINSEALLILLCSSHDFWTFHLTYSLPVFPCVLSAITWSTKWISGATKHHSIPPPSFHLPVDFYRFVPPTCKVISFPRYLSTTY